MGYEARTVQSTTTNTLPDNTDPAVDNTSVGDVQLMKLLNPTEGSVAPLIGQQARAGSVPMALSTEDAALLADLLTATTFNARIPALVGGRMPVDGSGVTQPISAASLPLPTGAATAVNQSSANTSLASIDGKLPNLSGGALPVTGALTDTQLRASAVPVSGTVAASNFPATVDTNSGNKSASTLRVVLATDQPALTTAQPVSLQPATSGGASVYRNLDLGSTGQVAKNGAGQLYGWYISNNASAARFVKIYDKASAATSSDTPVFTLQIPAGAAANVAFPNGVAFASGISVRATTGVADNDTGAPTTNDVIVNLSYK